MKLYDSEKGILPQGDMTTEVGGKARSLVLMSAHGIQVPEFLVIPTRISTQSDQTRQAYLAENVHRMVEFALEGPISIRSGAPVSMPGMMDTILNVGTCPHPVNAFEADNLSRLKAMWEEVIGTPFEVGMSIKDQITSGVTAVWNSWNNDRAILYRNMNDIPHSMGTAVILQRMVYGNRNPRSCSGVLFSKDPSTGHPGIVGEWMTSSQGEDIVAGTHTPESFDTFGKWASPEVFSDLTAAVSTLEELYGDMVDVEFTVDDDRLWVLQARPGKRTAQASLRIALDMADGDRETFVKLTSFEDYLNSTKPVLGDVSELEVLAKGIPASDGAVSTANIAYSSEDAVSLSQKGRSDIVLVVDETTPDDLAGMNAASAIVTRTGGYTSHAAVVARGMGKVCVVGCTGLPDTLDGPISVDGSSGLIYRGLAPVVAGDTSLLREVDKFVSGFSAPGYNMITSVDEIIDGRPSMILGAEVGADNLLLTLAKKIYDLGGEVVLDNRSHTPPFWTGKTEIEEVIPSDVLKLVKSSRKRRIGVIGCKKGLPKNSLFQPRSACGHPSSAVQRASDLFAC